MAEDSAASGGIIKNITTVGNIPLTIVDTLDENGGTIRDITADNVINLEYKPITVYHGQSTIVADTGYDGLSKVPIKAQGSGIYQDDQGYIRVSPYGAAGGILYQDGYITLLSSYQNINLPTETKTITENGIYDVTNYASAQINVSGSSEVILQTKTNITPTESSQTITPDTGYTALTSVQINGISTSYVGSGIARKSSSDLTASGATVTAPAGYYSSAATKTIANGTEGTPTTTKGTVSNNSVSITPSVTNAAGYIAGGTKTGTAVTVNASELVSGSLNITSNDTYDVTNYASVVVNVSSTSAITQDANGFIVLPTEGGGGGGSDSSSVQTATGTFTGSGGTTQSISCAFAPDLIYIYGDLSNDVSLRGVVSIAIIKDTSLITLVDGSTSAAQTTLWKMSNGITEYNESNQSDEPYASYSDGTLSIDMVENTSSARFNSSITYSYKLVKWSTQ